MENSEKKEKQLPKVVKVDNTPKPLFEDLNGHQHDSSSYEKLMREQTNIKKDTTKK